MMDEIACGLDIVRACLENVEEAFAAIDADAQGQKIQRKENVLRRCYVLIMETSSKKYG